jgi:coenzyme F420-0:L-glutamate ligase/coenzyme F420-1:gamma-L-glutamate ligase
VITIVAPAGIGEIGRGTDLAPVIADAVGGAAETALRPGDIVVVTSKIISKAEGRTLPATQRDAAIASESAATVAWRGELRIARTRTGLVQAAAGVDASNVATDTVLLLPEDPDASAERLRAALSTRAGGPIGVIISDTAGRAWRVGQTDHAIGAAGVRPVEAYAGRRDGYGNQLQVTLRALADEIAAAADLAKDKLTGRPVAVVRGLDHLVTDRAAPAASLIRPASEDMFRHGAREAVLVAVLRAVGRDEAYEDLVGLEGDALIEAALAGCDQTTRRVLEPVLRAG